jgi:hypothetical protein
MARKLFLGETALRVGIAALSKSCPNINEDLPYQVRSRVGAEAFHIFVAALEGAAPVLATENMHKLLSLCNEFGFTGFLSQVTDFLSRQPFVDDVARKDASDIPEEKLQIRQPPVLSYPETMTISQTFHGRSTIRVEHKSYSSNLSDHILSFFWHWQWDNPHTSR